MSPFVQHSIYNSMSQCVQLSIYNDLSLCVQHNIPKVIFKVIYT
jgi:hypothetical protein